MPGKLAIDMVEAIEKNLPGEVGGVLKKRLEQADKDADALESYKAECEEKGLRLKEYSKQADKRAKDAEKFKDLEERGVEVRLREAIIELREKYSAQRCADAEGFLKIIFHSRAMRETVTSRVPMGGASDYRQTMDGSETKVTEEDN